MITQSVAILVLNAGSSSLKFSLYEVAGPLQFITKGQYSGLGAAPQFSAQDEEGKPTLERFDSVSFGHDEAFRHLMQWLHNQYASRFTLVAVGHRMTHGGSDFAEPTLITPAVVDRLREFAPLAPLHLPHNLSGVKAVYALHPHLPQVACFDTAFHRNRSPVTERYGLPHAYFDRGVRRWGFHGLSYNSIAAQFRQFAPAVASGRVIVAHLGSGASLCAMKAGRSIDTTMGFSPLDGVPMGTRCGGIDPGVLLYLLRTMTPDELQDLLYNQSGLLGLSGVSSDMRVLLESKDPRAAEAVEYYVYRITREIGSLTAAIDGLDALIFTAGVGENSAEIRRRICDGLDWFGISIDPDANARHEKCISRPGRSPSVWVLATDEESVIAAQTYDLIAKLPVPARTAMPSPQRETRAAIGR